MILMLLDNLGLNFQSDQQRKCTPLHAAAQKGSVEICHVLLQVGVTPLPTSPSNPSLRPLPGASLHLLLTGRSQHHCRR